MTAIFNIKKNFHLNKNLYLILSQPGTFRHLISVLASNGLNSDLHDIHQTSQNVVSFNFKI